MKISEIITDKYKLRIPPTVYYELLYDVQEVEEEQESFINKPCVSSGVCEHDKNKVLDKIRAEIKELPTYDPKFVETYTAYGMKQDVLKIFDKYKAESEEE